VLGQSLDEGIGPPHRYRFGKEFHVSPFMDLDVDYDWRFGTPGAGLSVHMENFRSGERFFDATMVLRREEMTGRSLARVLLRYPLMTTQVIAAIHWQALRLWVKRCPVIPHPDRSRHSIDARRISG